jgi:hypothetical protein
MEEHRISNRVLYMNLETTRPRGRPRNRWQEKEAPQNDKESLHSAHANGMNE